MENNNTNNRLSSSVKNVVPQKNPGSMTVSVLKQGRDFNDYEIKNSSNGQTSRTRVVFLAD